MEMDLTLNIWFKYESEQQIFFPAATILFYKKKWQL